MTQTGRARSFREFGSWLKERRESRGWTQIALARRMGYSVSYVRKIEYGSQPPTFDVRSAAAHALDVPLFAVPDASGATSRRRPLPTPATPLLGRDGQVDEIVALLLGRARLHTLVGAPGIGKTRVAIEVAARMDKQFDDGACFVDLVAVADPAKLPSEIAIALGVPEPEAASAVDSLCDHLRGMELLLVLDNADHLLDAKAVIGRLVKEAPRLRALVTSREALRLSGEQRYPVPALETPDLSSMGSVSKLEQFPALALFVDRFRAVRPGFTLGEDYGDVIAMICRHLQGIPLAIELVAANGVGFDPSALLRQLDKCLDLPFPGAEDGPAHHQTLRAAIDWSYRLLDVGQRRLFARLGVFVAGFTIEAAVVVCGDSGAGRGVADLVGKSLLDPRPRAHGGARFTFFEAVREYAVERLAAGDEEHECRHRHLDYFVDLAERAESFLFGKEQAHWLDVLDDEQANLSAAMRWAYDNQPLKALRLAGALWRAWWMRGHIDEGREMLSHALASSFPDGTESVPEAGDPILARELVRALNGAGVLARTQGEYPVARRLFGRAAAIAEPFGDDAGVALALLNLGICADNTGGLDEAVELFEESERIYARIGAERGRGHALNCLGMVATDRGDDAKAQALFEASYAVFEELGDEWSTALVVTNLGWTAYKREDLAQARAWYDRALKLWRSLGDPRGVANALLNLGRVALRGRRQAIAEASGCFEESLVQFRRLGDRRGIAECLEALALTAAARHDPARAGTLLSAATALRTRIGAPLSPAEETVLEGLRADLGPALGPGATLSVESAINLALRRGD